MLATCHDRVERMLNLQVKLQQHLLDKGCDEPARQAARDVMRYFDIAAPLHHQDEELHVFPPLLAGPDATLRALVQRLMQDHRQMEHAWAEARRTLTLLALYGYRVDALIANRVFPASDDPFLAGWATTQAHWLDVVRTDAGSLPVLEIPYSATEPVGLAALVAVGQALHAHGEPAAPDGDLLSVSRTADGFALSLALPLARLQDVELSRSGDELVVTVAGRRRVLALPSALRRCRVVGALLTGGRLVVRFEPDPELWMRQ